MMFHMTRVILSMLEVIKLRPFYSCYDNKCFHIHFLHARLVFLIYIPLIRSNHIIASFTLITWFGEICELASLLGWIRVIYLLPIPALTIDNSCMVILMEIWNRIFCEPCNVFSIFLVIILKKKLIIFIYSIFKDF